MTKISCAIWCYGVSCIAWSGCQKMVCCATLWVTLKLVCGCLVWPVVGVSSCMYILEVKEYLELKNEIFGLISFNVSCKFIRYYNYGVMRMLSHL